MTRIVEYLITMFFFFFKQKTAYDMRISDWSSDVCSSDLSVMRGRTDHHRAVAQSGDRHDEGIALLDCANPGWRAGIDQVAGFKPVEAGYISYRFGNAPNQLGQVGVLPNFAIDRQDNPTGGEMAGLRRRVQEAERSRLLDIFARIPRPLGRGACRERVLKYG